MDQQTAIITLTLSTEFKGNDKYELWAKFVPAQFYERMNSARFIPLREDINGFLKENMGEEYNLEIPSQDFQGFESISDRDEDFPEGDGEVHMIFTESNYRLVPSSKVASKPKTSSEKITAVLKGNTSSTVSKKPVAEETEVSKIPVGKVKSKANVIPTKKPSFLLLSVRQKEQKAS